MDADLERQLRDYHERTVEFIREMARVSAEHRALAYSWARDELAGGEIPAMVRHRHEEDSAALRDTMDLSEPLVAEQAEFKHDSMRDAIEDALAGRPLDGGHLVLSPGSVAFYRAELERARTLLGLTTPDDVREVLDAGLAPIPDDESTPP